MTSEANFARVAAPLLALMSLTLPAAAPAAQFAPLNVSHLVPLHVGEVRNVACPSAKQCTAVSIHGEEVTFSPTTPVGLTSAAVVTRDPDVEAVACVSVTQRAESRPAS
jgi:hypothetical protein